MIRRLADLTWPELDGTARAARLVVPLGATEQHGPHLPFTVDTEIATALAERLAGARPWAVLAPALPYGSSGEHAGFGGTLSIGQRVTELLLVELVRSADAFGGVLLVCGHGGNAAPLRRAVATSRAEGRDVLGWLPRGDPGDTHAGNAETSAMLVLRAGAVRTDRLAAGVTEALPALLPALRRDGVRAVSGTGVLGDPTGASARHGERVLADWASDLITAADRWYARSDQPL